MLAVVGEIGTGVRIRVARLADRPLDPEPEIDSPAFLKALQDGPPVAERAFRDLVVRLRPSLLRYLGRWLRDAEEAEDAFQETCLALHHGLPTYRGPGRLTTWVYSLACHKVRERVSEKYGSGGEDGIPGLPAEELAATDPAPDEAAHQSLLLAWIRSAADTLPAHYRAVWELCDVGWASGEEAATALGISHALARVRLHRARGLIADRLRKERPGLFRKTLGEGDRLRALRARTLSIRWRRP